MVAAALDVDRGQVHAVRVAAVEHVAGQLGVPGVNLEEDAREGYELKWVYL